MVLHGTGLRVTVLTLNFVPVSKVGESGLSSHSLSFETEGEDSEWDLKPTGNQTLTLLEQSTNGENSKPYS